MPESFFGLSRYEFPEQDDSRFNRSVDVRVRIGDESVVRSGIIIRADLSTKLPKVAELENGMIVMDIDPGDDFVWPKQTDFLRQKVRAFLHQTDGDYLYNGTIIRDDAENSIAPIIKLDNGKTVFGFECFDVHFIETPIKNPNPDYVPHPLKVPEL
jgi:hypothetical protein